MLLICHPYKDLYTNSILERRVHNKAVFITTILILLSVTGNLNIVASGAIFGWTSPILPKLEQNNPIALDNQLGRPITKDEGSWLGALASLGVLFGSFISGYLSER